MQKYAANEPGVSALRGMASKITESSEAIKSLADNLESVASDNADTLGPHQASLEGVIEEIRAAQSAATDPVIGIADRLNGVADGYQEVIDSDPYSGITGN